MNFQITLLNIQHRRSMKAFLGARESLMKAIERAHLFLSFNKRRIEKLHMERQKIQDTNQAIEVNIAQMTRSVNHINEFIGE